MVYYHEEHLTAYERGQNVSTAMKTEVEEHWRRSYVELKRAGAVGAFLISTETEAPLDRMWLARGQEIDESDWYSCLESDYVASRDCLRRVVVCAKDDLKRSSW